MRLIKIFGGHLICREGCDNSAFFEDAGQPEVDLEAVKRKLLPVSDEEIEKITAYAAYPRQLPPRLTPVEAQGIYNEVERTRMESLMTRRNSKNRQIRDSTSVAGTSPVTD